MKIQNPIFSHLNNKVILLVAAQAELEGTGRLHLSLVGIESARRVIERIYETLEQLCNYPNMGALLSESDLRHEGYRRIISGNYLCFYRVIGKTVFVYHIADGRTEYKRLLKDLTEE